MRKPLTNNCTNCHFGNKIQQLDSNYYIKCTEHPGEGTSPRVLPFKVAETSNCSNYVSKNDFLCQDCKYFGQHNQCMNIKNATVTDDKLHLKFVTYKDTACDNYKWKSQRN